MMLKKDTIAFAVLALVIAVFFTRGVVARPAYTDAYYYFNAATRLADGDGLTDAYLWNYIGAPDNFSPAGDVPSHTYWMPLTSMLAAGGMWLFGDAGDFRAAQWPFMLLFFGVALIAYWLGGRMGGTGRHAWAAGLLVLFSGFFTRFWGTTDAFAPYAFVGSLALVFVGLALKADTPKQTWRYVFIGGVLAGFGHLARADGLLLLLAGWCALLWPLVITPLFGQRETETQHRVAVPATQIGLSIAVMTLGYLLVMGPWFVRNLDAIGTALPVGGTDAIWFTSYDALFNYPPGASPDALFADGLGTFFDSRWTALTNNLGTFVAVEGLVIMAPLMLIGLWNRRCDPFLRGLWIYALGLHLAMTFVFPFPGYRGGLFHSAAALVPWWAALGLVGLDDVIAWIAGRRRSWKPRTARRIFTVALVVLAVVLSLSNAGGGGSSEGTPGVYTRLQATLPPNARVMINDPTALYYFTGIGGVVIPNADPAVIPQIAAQYEVDYLLLERQGAALGVPRDFEFDIDNPPPFLREVEFEGGHLYRIEGG